MHRFHDDGRLLLRYRHQNNFWTPEIFQQFIKDKQSKNRFAEVSKTKDIPRVQILHKTTKFHLTYPRHSHRMNIEKKVKESND